jgi:DHA2 family multidrug resistance protein
MGLIDKIRYVVRNPKVALHPRRSGYKWWVLLNVMIGTFMAVLDATIVNVGLPKIMASFGVGIDKIEWILTGYMLAMALMLPTSGWLADRFGYKKVYFLGLLFFTFGSFLCGISGDENMLIFSRIIQGLGAGAVMPLGMAIVLREFPPNQRGIAVGFWSIAAAASVSFGPLIGGYLVDNFNWQLIFDVNVPIGIIGLFATVIIQKEYINEQIRKFDFIGFISISIFLPLVLYALTESTSSSNAAGWSAPYILVCFAIATVALAAFLTAELTVKEPLIDLKLLANRNFGISNIIMFIFGFGMFGSTFLLPLYLQNSLGYTAIQSGAVFLPIGIIQGATAPIIGIISDKINPKLPLLLGIVLLATSFLINGYLSYLSEHGYIMNSLYIRGLGMGMIFTPLSTVALLEIRRDKMAQASSIFNTLRQLGGSFGVAVLATVFTSRIHFHAQMFGENLSANSPAYKGTLMNLSYFIQHYAGSNAYVSLKQSQALLFSHLTLQAFVQSIDDGFLIAGIITIISIIPILFLHTKKKQQNQINHTGSYE